ncbi:hypothetical protein J2W15_002526 [Pseudarthrobacter sulfonivorans]|nr:hypothetical protein [Pseudarthrobacter sulfonivorans]
MIFPKKGQVWTYKEGAKFFALSGAVPGVLFMVIGIATGIWLIIAVAGMAMVGSALIWVGAERKHGDEP